MIIFIGASVVGIIIIVNAYMMLLTLTHVVMRLFGVSNRNATRTVAWLCFYFY